MQRFKVRGDVCHLTDHLYSAIHGAYTHDSLLYFSGNPHYYHKVSTITSLCSWGKRLTDVRLIYRGSNTKQIMEKDLNQGILGVGSTWC